MAEKRMFAKSIVLSDAFLDMPMSARCLYFTLNMFADDDGFVSSPKGIMRQCGASEDDLRVLMAKRYVLAFESGVIVIKHWRINNYLRKDRHTDTTYQEELSTLTLDEKGAYVERGQPSIEKNSIEEYTEEDNKEIDKSKSYRDSTQVTMSFRFTEDEMMNKIISAWNERRCIRTMIDRIPPLGRRYSDTFLCIAQFGFEAFMNEIEHLDDNKFFDEWHPTYDWFCNPNNFNKVYDGNYKQGKPKEVDKHSKEFWDSL